MWKKWLFYIRQKCRSSTNNYNSPPFSPGKIAWKKTSQMVKSQTRRVLPVPSLCPHIYNSVFFFFLLPLCFSSFYSSLFAYIQLLPHQTRLVGLPRPPQALPAQLGNHSACSGSVFASTGLCPIPSMEAFILVYLLNITCKCRITFIRSLLTSATAVPST